MRFWRVLLGMTFEGLIGDACALDRGVCALYGCAMGDEGAAPKVS
jgi:hypothetical protein